MHQFRASSHYYLLRLFPYSVCLSTFSDTAYEACLSLRYNLFMTCGDIKSLSGCAVEYLLLLFSFIRPIFLVSSFVSSRHDCRMYA
ncbi:hypothetical protein IWZ00DRAFT_37105 [Phyllosticta capitalensis]|uniref:Secreted protein n=1 Tax=Phyllosticta capitalensis TaxID=121624 RepID=A0ABR1Z4B0_9PEZI